MDRRLRAVLSGLALLLVVGLGLGVVASTGWAEVASAGGVGWPTYAGAPGGDRFSTANEITPGNVTQLQLAWTFHTGALDTGRPGTRNSSFEATPILFRGLLYLTTPFDDVFALDPVTGAKRWAVDTHTKTVPHGIVTSRGVAAWPLPSANAPVATGACAGRIFVATMDDRLLALDAASGAPCADFGKDGTVDLAEGMDVHRGEEYFFSSPPTVIGDLVVVGSGIGDNLRVDAALGTVRAFDARTGKKVWRWDPIPWANAQKLRTGAANAWSVISADPEHDLLFVPTGSPSPDFYGGLRPGDNRDANSVVALQASTGKRVWAFQAVHHDLWDYDVASEPVLFLWHNTVPAVAMTTKMGLIFVLNRLTGEPLFPVEERPVPKSDIAGEVSSPTQPFQQIATLAPITLPATGMVSDTPEHSAECRELFKKFRYEGIYTPPSRQGSMQYPGNTGGVNWGGAAVDPTTGVLYANTNRDVFSLQTVDRPAPRPIAEMLDRLLVRTTLSAVLGGVVVGVAVLLLWMVVGRRWAPGVAGVGVALLLAVVTGVVLRQSLWERRGRITRETRQHFGYERSAQIGAPFQNIHDSVQPAGSDALCTPTPWGTVSAVDLNTGKEVFQVPLGTKVPGKHTGTLNLGGDIVTATGLVFTGASQEPLLRAFDAKTGDELWTGKLPVPAQSTPMTYEAGGRQFVVIAAGGHGLFQTQQGDAVVAYALPAGGER